MSKKDVTFWNVPVDRPLNEALEEAVALDWHRTKSEFIRGAVRQKLEGMGFRPPRPRYPHGPPLHENGEGVSDELREKPI